MKVDGDLEVDATIQLKIQVLYLDRQLKEAVGDKKGIKRYGNFMLPMDELVLCAIDLSGRPYFVMDLQIYRRKSVANLTQNGKRILLCGFLCQ